VCSFTLKICELAQIRANDQAIAPPNASIGGTLVSTLSHHRQHPVTQDDTSANSVSHIRQNKAKNTGFQVARI
jgi:hypothetical protein